MEATARELARRRDDDLLALLEEQAASYSAVLRDIDPAAGSHAYAPGKWTLAESLVHVCDTERVFAYRLLRVARGDQTALPGFDQDAWVPESRASNRSPAEVLQEFQAIRAATLALVASLDDTALSRSGFASGHAVSARALVWMIAGHAAHHLRIVGERYLGTPSGH
jgi:uncharacterized damage-inducible protein DinB